MKLVDTPEKKGLDLKSRSELEISYMKMEERDRLLEEKGKRIGRIEGEKAGRIQGERNRLISQVQKKLAKNQSPAEIADALEEDENVILALIANTAQRSCARYQPTATFWGCRTKCIHCLVRQPLRSIILRAAEISALLFRCLPWRSLRRGRGVFLQNPHIPAEYKQYHL